ncbi:hypothetical protein SRHO_G00327540, partial [Serrasalmus rhombeus]
QLPPVSGNAFVYVQSSGAASRFAESANFSINQIKSNLFVLCFLQWMLSQSSFTEFQKRQSFNKKCKNPQSNRHERPTDAPLSGRLTVMLSRKSAQEISWMLDDYGIKHGPVVVKRGCKNSELHRKCRDTQMTAGEQLTELKTTGTLKEPGLTV